MVSSLFRATVAVFLSTLVACSGGNDSPNPSNPPLAQVEYLAGVRQVAAADEDKFVEQEEGLLLHTTASPFSVGDVLIWNGRAFKITAAEPIASGQFRYATSSPDFQEVFETLKIEADFAINLAKASTTAQVRPQFVTSLPDFTIEPNFRFPGLSMTGKIADTQGTIIFDYSALGGLRRAELLLRGSLTLNAEISVKGGLSIREEFTAGTPVNIPIPATLGTVSIKIPVGVFLEIDSEFQAKLFDWNSQYDFIAGARYDPVSQSFVNISSIQEASSSSSIPDRTALDKALQTIVRIRTGTQEVTTVSRIFVGPSIKPSLVVLGGSVGVLGLRNNLGLEAAVEVRGSFPNFASCARMPLAVRYRVDAVLNFKSLLDFDDTKKSATVFDTRLDLPSALKETAQCNAGVPYSSSYRTTSVELGAPIREECDAQGRCMRTLFCNPGDVVGNVESVQEQWALDALAGTAGLVSDSRTYSGTFNPVTGQVLVIYTRPREDITPTGSDIRFFSTQSSTLTAAYDPVTRIIRGNFVDSVATLWSYDARSVSCRSMFAYESRPIP